MGQTYKRKATLK